MAENILMSQTLGNGFSLTPDILTNTMHYWIRVEVQATGAAKNKDSHEFTVVMKIE